LPAGEPVADFGILRNEIGLVVDEPQRAPVAPGAKLRDPKYAKLEPDCRVLEGLGRAPEAPGVILSRTKLENTKLSAVPAEDHIMISLVPQSLS